MALRDHAGQDALTLDELRALSTLVQREMARQHDATIYARIYVKIQRAFPVRTGTVQLIPSSPVL